MAHAPVVIDNPATGSDWDAIATKRIETTIVIPSYRCSGSWFDMITRQ